MLLTASFQRTRIKHLSKQKVQFVQSEGQLAIKRGFLRRELLFLDALREPAKANAQGGGRVVLPELIEERPDQMAFFARIPDHLQRGGAFESIREHAFQQ